MGGMGKKPKKNSCKAKCPKTNSFMEKPNEKKFMHKMGRILILSQNYNSSRRVFQNVPNRIRACLDFQNFPGGQFPRTPQRKWASKNSNTAGVICRTPNAQYTMPNAERGPKSPKQAKTNRSAIQANRSVSCTQVSLKITPVSLNIA